MASLHLDFTSDNVEHGITLERTDDLSEKVLSIEGRNYKLLGSQDALKLMHEKLKNLPSPDFANFKRLEVDLMSAGPAEKTASVFQKVTLKLTTRTAAAVAEDIRKCNGSQDEVKKILFKDIPKNELSRLMEVVEHLAREGESIKAGYAYSFIEILIPEGKRAPTLLQVGLALLQRGKEKSDLLALDIAEYHLHKAFLDSKNEGEREQAKTLINEIISCAKQIGDTDDAKKEGACNILDRIEVVALLSQALPAHLGSEEIKSYADLSCENKQALEQLKKEHDCIRKAFTIAEAYQKRVDAANPQHPGILVQIPDGEGSIAMHYKMSGKRKENEPVVILEGGTGCTSHTWSYVQDRLGKDGPLVISYDRAGLGWSERGRGEPSYEQTIARLEALLKALKVSDVPIIYVGHSYGGVLAQLFALKNPSQVRGMILVDSPTEPTGEPISLKTVNQHLPPAIFACKFIDAEDEKTAHLVKPLNSVWETMIQESHQAGRSLELLNARLKESKTPAFDIPIKVLSAGLCNPNQDLLPKEEQQKQLQLWLPWSNGQKELVKRSKNAEHIIAKESDHYPLHHEPDLVAQQILEMVSRTSK